MHTALENRLRCLDCGESLGTTLTCQRCGSTYPREEGIYDFAPADPDGLDALGTRAADRAAADDRADLEASYEEYVSDAERGARAAAGNAMVERLERCAGLTVELATGMGGLVGQLLEREGISPVATDISPEALRQLRAQLPGEEAEEGAQALPPFVACDARELPFLDGAADTVLTAGGFNNIQRAETAIAEAARVLGDGGRLLALNLFVEPETESAARARELGVETAYLREAFEVALQEGFRSVDIEVVERVEMGENPYDVMPVAGDVQTYAVVEAIP
ncbi:MAG: class I SAM-dependent methyltransferase [Halodesulfurarchaeum sp.]